MKVAARRVFEASHPALPKGNVAFGKVVGKYELPGLEWMDVVLPNGTKRTILVERRISRSIKK